MVTFHGGVNGLSVSTCKGWSHENQGREEKRLLYIGPKMPTYFQGFSVSNLKAFLENFRVSRPWYSWGVPKISISYRKYSEFKLHLLPAFSRPKSSKNLSFSQNFLRKFPDFLVKCRGIKSIRVLSLCAKWKSGNEIKWKWWRINVFF